MTRTLLPLTSRALRGAVLSLCILVPASVLAGPVVGPGKKPGAAASWTSAAGAVTLKIAAGYDASEVAKAIGAGVKGSTTKVEKDTVVVTGVAEAALLEALEKIEVKESAGGGDDVDAMLSAMQKPGGEEEGSGSSIRATQAADFSEILGAKQELLAAKVVTVDRKKFPLVFVTVKLTQVPKGSPVGLKAGGKIKVLPRVKSKSGVVDPTDQASTLNVGAWYAQPGDAVLLRLEKDQKDGVWIAAAFDRNGAKK